MNEKNAQNSIDNTADIDRARRARRRRYRLRRLLGFLLLAAVLVGIAASLAVYFNIDAATYFDNLTASLKKGGGFPIDTQYVTVLDLLPMDGGVAMVSTSGVDLYNAAGAATLSLRGRYIAPAAKTAGGRLLFYDLGGSNITVTSKTKTIYTAEAKGGILAADITARGVFAYAQGGSEYLSEVAAYNAVADEIFRWRTGECYVTALAVNADDDTLAAAGVVPAGGTVSSTLRLFRFGQEEAVAAIDLPGQLVLSAVWNREGRLQLITDRAVFLYDRNGTRLASFEHGGALQSFENSRDGRIYLASGDYRSETGLTVSAYDAALQKTGETRLTRKLLSMRLNSGRLFLLTEGQLLLADEALSEVKDRAVDYLFFVCPADTVYYGVTTAGLVKEKL